MESNNQPIDQPGLLIVEDDPDFGETLTLEFSERGYLPVIADTLSSAREQLKNNRFRFAIVDLRLRGDSGLDVLQAILDQQPDCRVVMLTGYGSIPTAVEAVRRGAFNYLTKPVPVERLERALWVALGPDGSEENETIESLERHEQDYIEYVLLHCEGNISQAARWLGLHRQSLQRKLKRIGLK